MNKLARALWGLIALGMGGLLLVQAAQGRLPQWQSLKHDISIVVLAVVIVLSPDNIRRSRVWLVINCLLAGWFMGMAAEHFPHDTHQLLIWGVALAILLGLFTLVVKAALSFFSQNPRRQ